MKSSIEIIIFGAIFALGVNTLLSAQPGRTWAVKSTTAASDVTAPTNDERVALANCMVATEQVRSEVSEMQVLRKPWGRGRVGYSRNDLVAISDYREELKPALTNLVAVHQEFLKGLSEAQKIGLDQRLKKLDHLQAEFSSKISEFDHDLMRAEPGLDSTGISWDVDGLKRVADKWRSEHRKIEKGMGFGPDQSSIDQSPSSSQYVLSYARHTGKE